jgi:exodeoxyribonuclease VII small subunit
MGHVEVPTVQDMTFELARDKLEQVVRRLEEGDVSLEEAISLYEEGQALARYCQSLLDGAELRISQLADDEQESQ